MPLQQIPITDLGAGVNDYNKPDGIGNGEIQSTSRNIRGDAEFCIQRLGYVTFGDLITGNNNGIRCLAPYYRNADTDDRLFMVYGTTMYLIDPTTPTAWTALTAASFTSGTNIDAVSYGDWLFVFNGVDKPHRVANTTVSQPMTKPDSIASANNFLPSFGDIYNNRLFVAGVPTSPNSVYISKSATTAQPTYVYDFSGTIASGIADANEVVLNNRITAIRKLSTAIVIFTVDGAVYIPGFRDIGNGVEPERQPIGGSGGAVSQKSTVVVNNDIYYLTANKEIRSIRRDITNNQQSMVTLPISRKIQRFLDDEIDTDLSSAFGYFAESRREVHFYLRRKGEVNNSIRIVGNLDRMDESGAPAWYIDDNMAMRSGTVMKGVTYIGSTTVGQVYEDGVGNADDDDSAIASIRVSKEYVANDSLMLKNFKGVHIFGDLTATTELTADVYIDDVLITSETISIADNAANSLIGGIGTEEVGNFEVGDEGEDSTPNQADFYNFVKRIPLRKRGKKLVLVISADGTNNEFNLSGYTYFIDPITSMQYSVSERS